MKLARTSPLIVVAGTALGTLVGVRVLRPAILKARNALVGERAQPDHPVELLTGFARIGALYLCPQTLPCIPRWIASLLARGTPLSSETPWMPYGALAFLEEHLPPQAAVFEYGGGGSTLWLARRAAAVTTVEHEEAWHALLAEALAARGVMNVTLLRRPPRLEGPIDGDFAVEGVDYGSARAAGSFAEYVREIDAVPDASLDLVVVDGRSRAACLLRAMPKLRPGGVLVLDDAYRTRYDPAKRALGGWPRREFCGLRPSSLSPSQTTCWIRPTEE